MLYQNVKLRPSRYVYGFIGTVCLLCVLIIVSYPLPVLGKLLLVTSVIIYSAQALWQHGMLRSNASVMALRYFPKGDWQFDTREGQFFGKILGESTVTSVLMILRLRDVRNGKIYNVLILPDTLSRNEFRQLIMRVRFSRT
jgi:hypothetical protein